MSLRMTAVRATLAGLPEVAGVDKILELAAALGSDQSCHVESAAHRRTSAANGSSALPISAYPRMRRQSDQCSALIPIQRAQFWKLGQNTQSGDHTHAGDSLKFFNMFIEQSVLLAQR